MGPTSSPASRRTTWHPGRRLRAVLLAVVVGSAFGLAFGLGAVNRPLLNAVVFYALGGLVAAAVVGVGVLCLPRGGDRAQSRTWRGADGAERWTSRRRSSSAPR